MKKKLKWAVISLAVVFLLLQLTNPARVNPPVKSDLIASTHPPGPVAATLVAACYDCHSDQTRWPWYSHIAPMSWLIANDVNDGRENLNLSEWPADDAKRAARRLENMSEKIDYGEMPPKKYTAIHADANLTDSQRKALTDWLDAEADQLKSSAK
jgi:Haem-binding domain